MGNDTVAAWAYYDINDAVQNGGSAGTPSSTWSMKFRFRWSDNGAASFAGGGNEYKIFITEDTSLVNNVEIRFYQDSTTTGHIELWDAVGAAQMGSDISVSEDAWVVIHATRSGTSVNLGIYNSSGGTVGTTSGTMGGSPTTDNTFNLGGITNANSKTLLMYFDDVFIDGSSTSGVSTSVYDAVVDIRADALGATNSFDTASDAGAGSRWLLLNDDPVSTTGYVEHAASSTARELFGCTNPSDTYSAILGVRPHVYSAIIAGGSGSTMNAIVRSGTTNYNFYAPLPDTSDVYSKVYLTDPDTSAAWGTTGLNALQIGVDKTNSGGRNCRLYEVLASVAITIASGTDVTSERDAKIHGQSTSNSERDAKIHGQSTSNSERDAKVFGTLGSDSERDAKVHGAATSNSERDAKVTGSLGANDERDAKIHGQASTNSERDAKVTGFLATNDERDATIFGVSTANSERDAKVIGSLTANAERDAKITGALGANDERDAKVHGVDTTSSERDAKVTGSVSVSDERDATIFGTSAANSERDAKVTGSLTANAERDAKVTGSSTANAERDAKVTGGVPLRSFMAGVSNTRSAGGTSYIAMSDNVGSSSIESNVSTPVSTPGTISGLRVILDDAAGTGGAVATLMKNGSATALVVSFSSTDTYAENLDDSVSVAAGDRLSLRIVNNGVNSVSSVRFSVEFLGDNANEQNLMWPGDFNTAKDFLQFAVDHRSTPANNEELYAAVMPTAGKLTNLRLRIATSFGSGNGITLTLRVNGADTGLVVTIQDTATTATALGIPVDVAAGDTVSLGVVQIGTPANKTVLLGITFIPDTAGESIVVGGSGLSTAATDGYYSPFNNDGNPNNFAATTDKGVPVPPGTFSKLYNDIDAVVGAGASVTNSLYINGASGALSVVIGGDSELADSDTSNSDAVAPGDVVLFRTNRSAGSGFDVHVKFGVVFTFNEGYQTDARAAKITGSSTANAERDAKIHGQASAADERDAKIHGVDTTSSERDAKVTGSLTSESERDAKITGQDSASSERDATIHGVDTTSSERDAKVTGVLGANDERDAKVTGMATSADERDAKITGSETASSSRAAKIDGLGLPADSERDATIHGQDTASSERDAKIHGQASANSERDAKIVGALGANSERDAKVTGFLPADSERDAKVVGALTASDERDAKIHGVATTSSERDAKVTGSDSASSERDAKITGVLGTNDERDAKIHGQASTSSERDAKIHGESTANSERDALITGQAAASSERDAKLHGVDTTSSERDAKIHGQDSTSSSRAAKIEGDGTVVASERDATIHGQASTSDERDAKVHGADAASSERDATIFGQDSSSSERDATVHGQDTDADERDAKVSGQDTAASERDAKVTGSLGAEAERAAKITGWIPGVGGMVFGRDSNVDKQGVRGDQIKSGLDKEDPATLMGSK